MKVYSTSITTVCLSVVLVCNILTMATAEEYTESLIVRPENGFLVTEFSFKFLRESFAVANSEFVFWPKSVFDIVQRYRVHELHLTLTQGHWRSVVYGYPGLHGGPSGAHLWAWFLDEAKNRTSDPWKDLIHSLSGMFCASLNQMHPTLSTVPEFAFRTHGVAASGTTSVGAGNIPKVVDDQEHMFVKYAALASENVCTENFTPLKKLLPCKSGSGLGHLLNPVELISARYHSLGVHVRHVCKGRLTCTDPSLELVLSLQTVFRSDRNNFDLTTVFGSPIKSACPVAGSSRILFDKSFTPEVAFSPNETQSLDAPSGRIYAVFDVPVALKGMDNGKPLNIKAKKYKLEQHSASVDCSPVSIHSYLAGVGQYDGVYVSQLKSRSLRPIKVLFSHMVPWYLLLYFHTLKVQCNGQITELEFTHLSPGVNRKSPHYYEAVFTIPSKSQCKISIDFDRALLRWTEYPPDANHGFYIPAPSVTFSLGLKNCSATYDHDAVITGDTFWADKSNFKQSIVQLFGEVLLVRLPTPDFSMPYNVICLVCTVVALAFGPVHNLTTKTLVLVDPDTLKEKGFKAKLGRFSQKFVAKLAKVVGERIAKLISRLLLLSIPVAIAYFWEDIMKQYNFYAG